MVDALNRLDQTDALVEQILRDRAKLEHHATVVTRNQTAMRRRIRWKPKLSRPTETKHYHNHEAASDTESDQLDWDPQKIDDDGYPLVDENGSTLVPTPREGPLDEMKRVR